MTQPAGVKDYEKGYVDGYKEGFNKACEPVIREKMLQNNPIMVSMPKRLNREKTAIFLHSLTGPVRQFSYNWQGMGEQDKDTFREEADKLNLKLTELLEAE